MRTRMLVFSGTLVLALLLVAGTSQAAAQRPPLDPAKCPKGFSTEFPTTKSMLLTATTTKQDAESFLDTSLYCPNACFDLSATLTLTYSGLRVVVSGSNRCNSNSMAPNDPAQTPTPRGCNAGEQQPQIVIVTKDVYSSFKGFRIKDQTVNKSRCDHNVIDAAVGKFASGLVKAAGGDPTGGEAQMQSALNDIRTKSDSNPLTGAPVPESAGSEALAEALRGLGIPAPQAGEIAKNSQSASDLIKAYQSGDPETIKAALQKAAKVANVSINDEVFNNVARLTPEQVAKVALGAEYGGSPANEQTFDSSPRADLAGGRYAEDFQSATSPYTDLMAKAPNYLPMTAKIESGGNPNVCSNTGACGLFQFIPGTWRTWSARWNYANNGNPAPLPDNARFDPTLSSQVTAYYANYNLQRYGGLIEQSGMDTNAALYAIHNLGDGGGPKFISAFAQDPNRPVYEVVGWGAVRNNPILYGNGYISLAQAQQKMLAGMSGSTNFTGTERSASPYASNTGYPAPTFSPYAIDMPGNQFGNQSPSYSLSQPPPPPPQPQQAQQAQQSQQVQQSQQAPIQSQSQGGVQGTGAPALGTYPPATRVFVPAGSSEQLMRSVNGVQTPFTGTASVATTPTIPAANIIAQPPRVTAGNPVQVSWSSVGMKEDTQCRILVNDTFLFAEGNEGNKTAISARSDAGATWKFTLRCTAQSGEEIMKTSSVEIR